MGVPVWLKQYIRLLRGVDPNKVPLPRSHVWAARLGTLVGGTAAGVGIGAAALEDESLRERVWSAMRHSRFGKALDALSTKIGSFDGPTRRERRRRLREQRKGILSNIAAYIPNLASASYFLTARQPAPDPGLAMRILDATKSHHSGMVLANRSEFDVARRKIRHVGGLGGNVGVLAHEIGHAMDPLLLRRPKTMNLLYGPVRGAGVTLGGLGAALFRDQDKARGSAIAGTVAALPMLGLETGASIRGARLLRKTSPKIPLKVLLQAFRGLPSYAALAAVPGLTYAMRKAIGGFDRQRGSIKRGSDEAAMPIDRLYNEMERHRASAQPGGAGRSAAEVVREFEFHDNMRRRKSALSYAGGYVPRIAASRLFKSLPHPAPNPALAKRMLAATRKHHAGMVAGPASNFDLGTRQIQHVGGLRGNVGGLGHELGHAMDPVFRRPHMAKNLLYGPVRATGGSLGALGAAALRDPEQARNSAIAGTVATLPAIAAETSASIRGARLMRKVAPKTPFKIRAQAFRGLPTYIAPAAAPLLTYAIRRAIGGFEHE